MKNKVKLPCGINKNGEIVYIENVKKGFACECFCPGCKQPLNARNGGKKNTHHFAHINKDFDCEHGYQSAIHLMAKECFQEMEYLTFMKNILEPVKYKIDSVVLEKKVSDIIPDIVVTCDGKPFIVEIFVTHAVDDEKINKIKKLQISAIEINLSRFKNEMIDKEMLKKELCKPENICWYYNADEDTDMIQQSYLTQKKIFIMEHGEYKQIKNNIVYQCPLSMTIINYRHIRYGNVCAELCQHCFLGYKPKDSNGIYCIGNYFQRINATNQNLKIDQWFIQANINENRFMTQEETESQRKSFKQKLKEYSL